MPDYVDKTKNSKAKYETSQKSKQRKFVDKPDESESSITRIEKINKITVTERNKNMTARVKVNGIVDTGSPISIHPADENIIKSTEIQKVKNRYQDVNKNEVNLRRTIPTDIEYENNKQKMRILITERNNITLVLKMD